MSRKHYQAIAAALRNIPDKATRQAVIAELLPMLKRDNPRFDCGRFLNACDCAQLSQALLQLGRLHGAAFG